MAATSQDRKGEVQIVSRHQMWLKGKMWAAAGDLPVAAHHVALWPLGAGN